MDDYISRSAFIEAKEKQYCQNCDRRKNSKGQVVYEIGDATCRACGIGDMLDDVEDFPAADVRPVVYCRDCENAKHWYSDKYLCYLWSESGIDVFADGFCSYGKRRGAKKGGADR